MNITGGGDTPSYRNSAAVPGVTIINNAATLKVTVTNQEGDLLEGVRVRYERSDGSLIDQGETNASGIFSSSIAVAELPLSNAQIIARRKDFEDFDTTLTIPTSGFDIPVSLQPDRDVDLP